MEQICRRCGILKPLTDYYLDRGNPRKVCKSCHCIRTKVWREANKERKKALDLAWQQNNRERYRKAQRQWRQNNPERMPIYRKKWLSANWEFNKLSHVNRESKRRAAKRKTGGTVATIDWLVRLKEFNDFCAYCLNPLNGNYHMEHMKPLSRGGSHTIDNVVPACPTCNYKKSDKTLLEFVSQVVEMR